uniref:Ribosomal protein S4/S9 N-terminal domain-containing protein n=1 Tax=Noctiluca scintillans TaxID=2966 RepID=A0A7S1A7T5_NOCSC|mmetsp:Transcript_34114/g.91000  ORF Transcript_34114/g.91000 Transcript_34114/m.91000 type:complete len:184 (+) Transcript_34114:62-613(+)
MRKLKHHEQRLLKKVNFYDWKSDKNIRENKVLKKFAIEDREDYTKYNKIANMIQKLVAALRKLKKDDADRIKMTEILLDKLYSMCCIQSKQSLEDVVNFPATALCRRRLPIVMTRHKFAPSHEDSIRMIRQGHVRIGPDLVTNPALHVTRDMEDHITWSEGSKIKQSVQDFKDERDDFELLGL